MNCWSRLSILRHLRRLSSRESRFAANPRHVRRRVRLVPLQRDARVLEERRVALGMAAPVFRASSLHPAAFQNQYFRIELGGRLVEIASAQRCRETLDRRNRVYRGRSDLLLEACNDRLSIISGSRDALAIRCTRQQNSLYPTQRQFSTAHRAHRRVIKIPLGREIREAGWPTSLPSRATTFA